MLCRAPRDFPRSRAFQATVNYKLFLVFIPSVLSLLSSSDEYVRGKEVGVDPGIELSSMNGRDSGNESEKSWLTEMGWNFLDR